MELTKEWLRNNEWWVGVKDEQEGATVFEYLQDTYGLPVTPYEEEQMFSEDSTGIAYMPTIGNRYMWFTSLGEDTFDNNITSLVLADMEAEKEKQMSEQKYVPVPEGGWTEENIPLEFEAFDEIHKYVIGWKATENGWNFKRSDGTYSPFLYRTTETLLEQMNDCCGHLYHVTKIIKPSKEQQMKEAAQSVVDNNSPLPFLKPFVRLVTRGRGSYIYQGVREGGNTPYPGMHHAVQSNQSYDVWGDDLLGQDPRWDVVAIHDVPGIIVYLLESEQKGKLLWQREDSKLKELQQAVEEATKALADYKREKGVA